MPETFTRLFARQEMLVESLNVRAAMKPERAPKRSQLSLLSRHFLERFFNHESASPDGDAKARLVQIACAAGLPPLLVAVYLWPVYHPFPGWPPGQTRVGPPPYWAQVNHHLFFVLWAFVSMGIAAVWEWDLFFPDLLDLYVLGTVPAPARRVFTARVVAITVFVVGFLVDANGLAPLALVAATDPPQAASFLLGDVLAVMLSGLFAAGLVVAGQSVLLALLGERLFRRVSLAVQGAAVTALVMMLLLFPVLSGVTPAVLQSRNVYAMLFPPFWFLAIGQQVMDGPGAPGVWSELAKSGWLGLLGVGCVGALAYPLAYARRVRQLVEGGRARAKGRPVVQWWHRVVHRALVRRPGERAVFHFIGQTMLRVPRYRIYLVLYGGVGVAMVLATVLRLQVDGGRIAASVSGDGVRAAIGIVAFWSIAGLRTAFVSSGNQRGGWVFRITHGRPPIFQVGLEQQRAAQIWAGLAGGAVTLATVGLLRWVAPAELRTPQEAAAEVLVACGVCVLLTDAFFIHVTTVAFTGEAEREGGNLAFTVLRYYTFFPFVTAAAVALTALMQSGARPFGIALVLMVVAHLWLRKRHKDLVRLACAQLDLEEGEEDFPMRLGLRY